MTKTPHQAQESRPSSEAKRRFNLGVALAELASDVPVKSALLCCTVGKAKTDRVIRTWLDAKEVVKLHRQAHRVNKPILAPQYQYLLAREEPEIKRQHVEIEPARKIGVRTSVFQLAGQ